jgi:hypothetical protein
MNDSNLSPSTLQDGSAHLTFSVSIEQTEIAKKRRELAQLEALLEERKLELTTLQLDVNTFSSLHRIHIGSRYAILDEIEAQIAEVLAARDPLDKYSQENAKRAREQAKSTAEETGTSPDENPPEPPEHIVKFQPSDDIKQLRRKLSKLAHPDYAENEEDRQIRTVFMQQVNEAFATQDIDRLRNLLEEWTANTVINQTNSVEAELKTLEKKIELLKNKLKLVEQEIDLIKSSEIFAIKLQFENAEKQGRNLFAEICAELDLRITNARLYLRNMKRENADG